jgi:hypothetical protein
MKDYVGMFLVAILLAGVIAGIYSCDVRQKDCVQKVYKECLDSHGTECAIVSRRVCGVTNSATY